MAYLANMMHGPKEHTAELLFSRAQILVNSKVMEKASADAAVALSRLPRSSLALIVRLLRGDLTAEMLINDRELLLSSRTFREMLLVLCEPPNMQPLKLLPS